MTEHQENIINMDGNLKEKLKIILSLLIKMNVPIYNLLKEMKNEENAFNGFLMGITINADYKCIRGHQYTQIITLNKGKILCIY